MQLINLEKASGLFLKNKTKKLHLLQWCDRGERSLENPGKGPTIGGTVPWLRGYTWCNQGVKIMNKFPLPRPWRYMEQ